MQAKDMKITVTIFSESTRRLTGSCLLAVALLATGCASVAPSIYRPESNNQAVMSLLENARNDAASGYYSRAEASLERALRIEPGNAYLWFELGQAALLQGDLREAENFALRADSLAGHNPSLKEDIWRLVAQSRAERGDDDGAQEAVHRANSY